MLNNSMKTSESAAEISSYASGADWKDWRWQLSKRVRSLVDLKTLLPLKPQEASRLQKVTELFPVCITPYYLSLADLNDPSDPILMQCIPDLRELENNEYISEDFTNESGQSPCPGLVHRYSDRALCMITDSCAVNCRHCMRKRLWRENLGQKSREDLTRMISYIRSHKDIRDVILSGGDPLMMSLDTLDWFMGEVRALPHVEIIRVHTRIPVVLPMRIRNDLLDVLSRHDPVWLVTQFNHPAEITDDSAQACDKLLRAGIPVCNQSVLLAGVNDAPEVYSDLCRSLLRIKVKPYYLHHCDPVRGAEHFRTSVQAGVEILDRMHGRVSGLAVPAFAVDLPDGAGKVTLSPDYFMRDNGKEIIFKGNKGKPVNYPNM